MSADPTWPGLGRALLVLAALWWAWAGYAWLTNTLEPEEIGVRVAMFASMAAMLVVALAVPGVFGDDGVLFGVAYFVVRALHLVLYKIAGRGDADMLGAVLRFGAPATVASSLLIVAGFMEGESRVALWIVALTIDYAGALRGGGRGWRVSPAHFTERHGLIVIIALGESIVAIGLGAAGLEIGLKEITAAVLAIVVVATLWWSYFDITVLYTQRKLEELHGVDRVQMARDLFTYLHLPLIAGIVLFALGLKKALEHVGEPLATVPAVALSGGLALYFLAHVAARLRILLSLRSFGRGRPVAGLLLLAVTPAVPRIPALAALALVAAIGVGLIVYDVVHYRDERHEARQSRWQPSQLRLPSTSTEPELEAEAR